MKSAQDASEANTCALQLVLGLALQLVLELALQRVLELALTLPQKVAMRLRLISLWL